ncbi:hypothetical protein BaRGS_00013989, partial [Batillaria attramentaria]
VLSGDTVVIRGQPKGGPPPEKTVCLSNIQAPKLARRANPNVEGSTETKDEPYAWEAREFLRKKLVGREVAFYLEYKTPAGREYGALYLGKGFGFFGPQAPVQNPSTQGPPSEVNLEEDEPEEDVFDNRSLFLPAFKAIFQAVPEDLCPRSDPSDNPRFWSAIDRAEGRPAPAVQSDKLPLEPGFVQMLEEFNSKVSKLKEGQFLDLNNIPRYALKPTWYHFHNMEEFEIRVPALDADVNSIGDPAGPPLTSAKSLAKHEMANAEFARLNFAISSFLSLGSLAINNLASDPHVPDRLDMISNIARAMGRAATHVGSLSLASACNADLARRDAILSRSLLSPHHRQSLRQAPCGYPTLFAEEISRWKLRGLLNRQHAVVVKPELTLSQNAVGAGSPFVEDAAPRAAEVVDVASSKPLLPQPPSYDSLLPSPGPPPLPPSAPDHPKWLDISWLKAGVPLTETPPQITVCVDASTQGWGALLLPEFLTSSGIWDSASAVHHINVLELLAVHEALKVWKEKVAHKRVMILSDNASVVAYIRNQGGTRSPELCLVVWKLLMWALENHTSVTGTPLVKSGGYDAAVEPMLFLVVVDAIDLQGLKGWIHGTQYQHLWLKLVKAGDCAMHEGFKQVRATKAHDLYYSPTDIKIPLDIVPILVQCHEMMAPAGMRDGENLTESLVAEGLVDVRRMGLKKDDVDQQRLIQLEEAAKAASKGKHGAEANTHVRDIKWSIENPRNFVDSHHNKPVDAVIEHVRDGCTVRAFLLPSFDYVTIMLSGVKTDDEGKQVADPFAEECKFFTESRLLQRDVKIILEGVSNQNLLGTILHPRVQHSVKQTAAKGTTNFHDECSYKKFLETEEYKHTQMELRVQIDSRGLGLTGFFLHRTFSSIKRRDLQGQK